MAVDCVATLGRCKSGDGCRSRGAGLFLELGL